MVIIKTVLGIIGALTMFLAGWYLAYGIHWLINKIRK
jgi:hypothetical protein